MPKINLDDLTPNTGTTYPAQFADIVKGRSSLNPGDAGGLTQFGAKIITLAPGAGSSQRHHHSAEDEFVYILSGYPTFIDDDGPQRLSPGDMTAHPAGDGNGHHMINETEADVVFLVIGSRRPESDHAGYPDIDMDLPPNGTAKRVFVRKDGSAF